MGKSAKITRGGNKQRVNEGRLAAKEAAAKADRGTGASKKTGGAALSKTSGTIAADSLKALQQRRAQEAEQATAVKQAPRKA